MCREGQQAETVPNTIDSGRNRGNSPHTTPTAGSNTMMGTPLRVPFRRIGLEARRQWPMQIWNEPARRRNGPR